MRVLETQKEAPERSAESRTTTQEKAAERPAERSPQASRFSPDLSHCPDRYRLVTPYSEK